MRDILCLDCEYVWHGVPGENCPSCRSDLQDVLNDTDFDGHYEGDMASFGSNGSIYGDDED